MSARAKRPRSRSFGERLSAAFSTLLGSEPEEPEEASKPEEAPAAGLPRAKKTVLTPEEILEKRWQQERASLTQRMREALTMLAPNPVEVQGDTFVRVAVELPAHMPVRIAELRGIQFRLGDLDFPAAIAVMPSSSTSELRAEVSITCCMQQTNDADAGSIRWSPPLKTPAAPPAEEKKQRLISIIRLFETEDFDRKEATEYAKRQKKPATNSRLKGLLPREHRTQLDGLLRDGKVESGCLSIVQQTLQKKTERRVSLDVIVNFSFI